MKSLMDTVTSKGQVTLPTEVRKHLGLQQGSRIVFVLDDDGHVALEVPKYPSVASLRGVAGSLPTPLAWSQVQTTIREERAARALPRPTPLSPAGQEPPTAEEP